MKYVQSMLLYKLLYKGLHVHFVNRSNVIVLIMFSLLDVFLLLTSLR